MSHTVVAVFENPNIAQTAVQQAEKRGIKKEAIDVSTPSTIDEKTGRITNAGNDDPKDSIADFFDYLYGSDSERSRHYTAFGQTRTIVTVHARSSEEANIAAEVLDEYGALNPDEHAIPASGYAGTRRGKSESPSTDTPTTAETPTPPDTAPPADTSVPVIEEKLQVGKRSVATGGVRLRSRIIERPVEEHLRLRQEHVYVERKSVNRVATQEDLNAFKEGDIDITGRAEVPAVSKEARVVEEINVGRNVEEREEKIKETVRKTDMEINKIGEEELKNRSGDPGKHS